MIEPAIPVSPPPSDDLRLLELYHQTRSEDAFAQIVGRHFSWVHSMCRRALRDPHLAEDAAQAVFLVLARRAGSISPDVRLTGWLFNAARFAISEARRREKRYQRRQNLAVEMAQQRALDLAADEQKTWEHVAPFLEDAVASLGTREREAILLHFYEGKTLRDVGQMLGLTRDGAKKRVSRALDKLRRFMARKGVKVSLPVLTTLLAARAVDAAAAHAAGATMAAAAGKCVPSAAAASIAGGVVSSIGRSTLGLLKAVLVAELVALTAVTVTTLLPEHRSAPAPAIAISAPPAAILADRALISLPVGSPPRLIEDIRSDTASALAQNEPDFNLPLAASYVSDDPAAGNPSSLSIPSKPSNELSTTTTRTAVRYHSGPSGVPSIQDKPLGLLRGVQNTSLSPPPLPSYGKRAPSTGDSSFSGAAHAALAGVEKRPIPTLRIISGGTLRSAISRSDKHVLILTNDNPYRLRTEPNRSYLVQGDLSKILIQDGPDTRQLSDIVRETHGIVTALAKRNGTTEYRFANADFVLTSTTQLWSYDRARLPRGAALFHPLTHPDAVSRDPDHDGDADWTFFTSLDEGNTLLPVQGEFSIVYSVAAAEGYLPRESDARITIRHLNAGSVPEPGGAVIGLLITGWLCRRRRRNAHSPSCLRSPATSVTGSLHT